MSKKKIVITTLLLLMTIGMLIACGQREQDIGIKLEDTTATDESKEAIEEVVNKGSNVVVENLGDAKEKTKYTFTEMTAEIMHVAYDVDARDIPNEDGNVVMSFTSDNFFVVVAQCNETGWYQTLDGIFIPGDCLLTDEEYCERNGISENDFVLSEITKYEEGKIFFNFDEEFEVFADQYAKKAEELGLVQEGYTDKIREWYYMSDEEKEAFMVEAAAVIEDYMYVLETINAYVDGDKVISTDAEYTEFLDLLRRAEEYGIIPEGFTGQLPRTRNDVTLGPTSNEKEMQARAVAQSIADSCTEGTDLERVRQAAQMVAAYCSNATHTTSDPDYSTAYGVFCKGVYTCAGSTRALGMVLECMGFSWSHVNANQWTHQWCQVNMDGQVGWADGMGGIADYGECPFTYGGSYTYNGITYTPR